MNTRFLFWWLVTVIEFIGIGVAVYLGAIDFLLDADDTYLSFVVAAMWLLGTLQILYIGFRTNGNFDTPWFIAESCLSVGMIGTLVGFMLMLGSSFGNVDPGDIESMKTVIASMAQGMSTALVTTLTGLVFSLGLKVQIAVLEHVDGK